MGLYNYTKSLITRSLSKVLRTIQSNDDFIVTGIPRSGTSLMCSLISEHSNNSYCFNEIHYDVKTLPYFFWDMRRNLQKGKPIPNKVDKEENITTDTNRIDFEIKEVKTKSLSGEIKLGSKVTIPYLNNIKNLINREYTILILVRDPLYTLASWNSEGVDIPESNPKSNNSEGRWDVPNLNTENKLIKQSQIWNYYANLIYSVRDDVLIIRYEDLTENQIETIKEIEKKIGVNIDTNNIELKNYNMSSRYDNINEIKKVVKDNCPAKKYFDY